MHSQVTARPTPLRLFCACSSPSGEVKSHSALLADGEELPAEKQEASRMKGWFRFRGFCTFGVSDVFRDSMVHFSTLARNAQVASRLSADIMRLIRQLLGFSLECLVLHIGHSNPPKPTLSDPAEFSRYPEASQYTTRLEEPNFSQLLPKSVPRRALLSFRWPSWAGEVSQRCCFGQHADGLSAGLLRFQPMLSTVS